MATKIGRLAGGGMAIAFRGKRDAAGCSEIVGPWGVAAFVLCLLLAPLQGPAQNESGMNISPQTSGHGQRELGNIGEETRGDTNLTSALSSKQRQSILMANFRKSKSDSAELAELAKGLREELNKANGNGLSAEVISRVERIEKLAKKIRDETRGY